MRPIPAIGAGLWMLCFLSCSRQPPGPSINARLLEAVQQANVVVVDSCLRRGADPNLRDDEGNPLIILALEKNRPELLKVLLDHGVQVDARRQSGYQSTALMETALRNDLEAASLLLAKGAGLNLRDSTGDTALHWAAFYGRIELTRLLVEHGANHQSESRQGTPLEVALWQFHDELAVYLAGVAGARPPGDFIDAVKKGDVARVSELLKRGADPDQTDETGNPALHLAVSQGIEAVVFLLLKNKANPNALNRVGQTALCRAAYFGRTAIARLLVERGAGVNSAGVRYRYTPLHAAARSGFAELGRWLIDKGAAVDAQEAVSGYTPLMIATAYGRRDMVEVLINAGANPQVKGFDGAALPDLINYASHPEIAKLLENYMLQR